MKHLEEYRVAVIGCGYVGSGVGEALARAGCDVVGTTTTPGRLDELRAVGIRPERVEVADVERLRTVLADREVVYLTIAPKSRSVDYGDVYRTAAANVREAVEETAVRRIIYTSSTRVYGQDDGSWVNEDSPTEPADANGRVLLETERVLLAGASRRGTAGKPAARGNTVCTTVVRLSGVYGPGRDPAARIKLLAGTQRDDGGVYVNMIHLDDIVAVLTALGDIAHHGVLNLSDDRPITRRAYYDRVLAEAGLPPIRWIGSGTSASRGKRVRNQRIKKLLDLTLKHPTRSA